MARNRSKYFFASGRRRIDRKSMSWMNTRDWPSLASRTASTSRCQARNEAIVADPHQRTARDVADAGRLDHDRAGAPLREARIPFDHGVGDEAVLGRPPRHHGRHPGALFQRDRADRDGREQPRGLGLGAGRNPAVFRLELDALRRTPHRLARILNYIQLDVCVCGRAVNRACPHDGCHRRSRADRFPSTSRPIRTPCSIPAPFPTALRATICHRSSFGPQFEGLDALGYPKRFNAAVELIDRQVAAGFGPQASRSARRP